MNKKFDIVNIRDLFDEDRETFIGEDTLKVILSSFCCGPNPDVEYFLIHNAVEFTKKGQSVTYLVFNNEANVLVGYFTLAIKPITVKVENLSRNAKKKIERVSVQDEASESYTLSAYLVAQLGKNYALSEDMQIPGEELLGYAYEKIKEGKYLFGGVVAFLECEDVPFLIDFYQKNGHVLFNERNTEIDNGHEPHFLHQLMKFV